MTKFDNIYCGWFLNHIRKVRRTHLEQKAYRKRWSNCKFFGDSTISDGVTLGPGCLLNRVELRGNVQIGRHTLINADCYFSGHIDIGSFCSIARNVTMVTGIHPLTTMSTFKSRNSILNSVFSYRQPKPKPIVIGSDVWIGSGAILLPGIEIGHGAVVGAGSIVTKSVEPYSIAVGCPARQTRFRFSQEKIDLLVQSEWWNWSDEKIIRNSQLFDRNLDQSSFELIQSMLEEST